MADSTKTALITGASRGVGAAIARALHREGWRVVINYNRSQDSAESLAKELGTVALKADVSDIGEVAAMFEAAGDVSLLVNNAAVPHYGLLSDMEPEAWRRLLDVNLGGVYNCLKFAIPPMVREKSGCIINISSVWGIYGASCEAAYSATKAAVIGLTRSLAKELGPSGVRVNCVAPGVILTDMLQSLNSEELAALSGQTPLGRLGSPEDVADAVAFLASDNARFITGQVLGVDGGFPAN